MPFVRISLLKTTNDDDKKNISEAVQSALMKETGAWRTGLLGAEKFKILII